MMIYRMRTTMIWYPRERGDVINLDSRMLAIFYILILFYYLFYYFGLSGDI